MLLRQNPYSLPNTAPKMKDGVRTPAGIGELFANIMRMNFLNGIKLIFLQNAIDSEIEGSIRMTPSKCILVEIKIMIGKHLI